jgi:DNA-binding LytR/AlgR family response regulator
VTNPPDAGTKPGDAVTGRRVPLAVATAWVLVQGAVNSLSVTNDLDRRGVRVDPAQPWIWELSSAASLLVCFWGLLVLDEALRARVRSGWARLVAYAAASVVFCVAHVAMMVLLRHVAYRLAGWQYDFGPWGAGLMYEYRKDVLTFIVMLVGFTAWRRLVSRTPAAQAAMPPTAEPAAAPTFLVRTPQGDLLIRADEIDWVEAQGNYVALHVQGQARLMRQTLAEMQTRLAAHGFIRTHRRALVNRHRMQAILTPDLGEPGVRLSSGQVAPLSESRRSEVLRLVLGAKA